MVGRNGVQTDLCPIYRAAQRARFKRYLVNSPGGNSHRRNTRHRNGLVGIGIVGRGFSRDIIAAVKTGL